MLKILVGWLVLTAVIALAGEVHPKVKVKSARTAGAAAAVLGVLNVVLGWLLGFLLKVLLFLPNLISFGLAYLFVPVLVNMALLKVTQGLLEDDVEIDGTGPLFLVAVAVAIAGAALTRLG